MNVARQQLSRHRRIAGPTRSAPAGGPCVSRSEADRADVQVERVRLFRGAAQ